MPITVSATSDPQPNIELGSLHWTTNFTRPSIPNTVPFTGGLYQAHSNLTGRSNNQHVPLGSNNAGTPVNFPRQSIVGGIGWRAASIFDYTYAEAFQFQIRTTGHDNIRFTASIKSTGSGPDFFELAWSTSSTGPFTVIPGSRTTNRQAPLSFRTDTYADFNWSNSNAWNNFVLPPEVNDRNEVYIRAVFNGSTTLGNNGNAAINRVSFIGDEIGSDYGDYTYKMYYYLMPGSGATDVTFSYDWTNCHHIRGSSGAWQKGDIGDNITYQTFNYPIGMVPIGTSNRTDVTVSFNTPNYTGGLLHTHTIHPDDTNWGELSIGSFQISEFVYGNRVKVYENGSEVGHIANGWYHIQGSEGRFLHVQNNNHNNGARPVLWNGSGATNTRWHFEHIGNGFYRITTGLYGNRSLEVRNSSLNNGEEVAIWDWVNIHTQMWRLVRQGDHFIFVNRNSGLALNVINNSNYDGAETNQWQIDNTDAQLFKIIPA